MIGKIKGILDKVSISEIIIDSNGIGYEICIPLSTYDKLPREGEKITLFTHLHVREDVMILFGFDRAKTNLLPSVTSRLRFLISSFIC